MESNGKKKRQDKAEAKDKYTFVEKAARKLATVKKKKKKRNEETSLSLYLCEQNSCSTNLFHREVTGDDEKDMYVLHHATAAAATFASVEQPHRAEVRHACVSDLCSSFCAHPCLPPWMLGAFFSV